MEALNNIHDLRVSKIAPTVEGSLVQLVELVKQIGRDAEELTESQNRKMVSYLGSLDDMRAYIVVMVQRYEDDGHVLKRLLNLIDRIDEVKTLVAASSGGAEDNGNSPGLSEKEIARHYDTPFNPLMVSGVNILEASGLLNDADEQELKAAEEVIEADGADFWDHPEENAAEVAAEEEEAPRDVNTINLAASSVNLPSLPPSPEALTGSQLTRAQAPPSFPPPPRSLSSPNIPPPSLIFPLPPAAPLVRSNSTGKREKRALRNNNTGRRPARNDYSSSDEERDFRRAAFRDTLADIRKAVGESASEDISDTDSLDSLEEGPPARHLRSSVKNPSSSAKKVPESGPCDPVLCKICYVEYNRYEELYEFGQCGHKYCRECLEGYLHTNITEGAVLDLTCPFPDCDTEILPKDIRALCSPELFSKYERFTIIAALRMDPNARWCPNPECNNGIKADPSSQWVLCDACGFEFCFHCMAERHDGAACGKEALDFLEKKKASETLAQTQFLEFTEEFKALVKPCPICHAYIEKNDGCNHMTCGNHSCRCQFCWLCLRLYTADHFSNQREYPECFEKQYWSPNSVQQRIYVQPPRRVRISNFAKRVGIYMGLGVAVVTLGVPAAVIGGPVYGCFRLHKRLQTRRQNRLNRQYHDPNFTPPSPARIAEAAREAARLRALEEEAFRPRR